MLSSFERQILEVISKNNGIKAVSIAKELGVDKTKVNSKLYGKLKSFCWQDSSYKWYSNTESATKVYKSDSSITKDETLSALCNYYLECLNSEGIEGVSCFLTSKYKLDYVELEHLKIDTLEQNDVAKFLQKNPHDETCIYYVGYPNAITKIYSQKIGKSFYKLIPVFLFPLDYDSGQITVNYTPKLNIEIVKKYSENFSGNDTYELLDLEKELGLNDPDNELELDEVVHRLQSIRQWNWKDKFDPAMLNQKTPITIITEEGIYNKAVIIRTKRPAYTIGLESELRQLSQLSEEAYKNTALYEWLHPTGENHGSANVAPNILEVLPLNTEQRQAITSALDLNSTTTVVTGPPGTGKSQVVVDLLINIAYKKLNVLFASKNNSAVDVVEKRINGLSSEPIMFRLGASFSSADFNQALKNVLNRPSCNKSDEYSLTKSTYEKKLQNLEKFLEQKENVIELRNQIDLLDQEVALIRENNNALYDKSNEEDIKALEESLADLIIANKNATREFHPFWIRIFWAFVKDNYIEAFEETVRRINNLIVQYGLKEIDDPLNDFECDIKRIKDCLEDLKKILTYKRSLDQLNNLESLEEIDKTIFYEKKELSELAEKLWKDWLKSKFANITYQQRVDLNRYATAIELNDEDFLKSQEIKRIQKSIISSDLFPCLGITSLSAKGRIPFLPGLFNVLVIDEASQCDIASLLPLLYRAKKVVVIGDPKQLTHVSVLSKQQDAGLLKKHKISLEWSYVVNSVYDIARNFISNDSVVHLRDHHRCFSDIIEFSNEEFYSKNLRVATDYRKFNLPKKETPGIRWIDVSGVAIKSPNGGIYNPKEVQQIVEELKRLTLADDYSGSIGVVTPFRAQVAQIEEAIRKEEELSKALLKNNFLVDTVHKFQGDEKDIILFSTVISEGASIGAIKFLSNTGNLFNVAITRARSMLVVVGNQPYCSTCEISYLQHFVNYFKHLEDKKTKEQHSFSYPKHNSYPIIDTSDFISDWEKYFYTRLFNAGIKTIPQYPVDKYKLDLALLSENKNRKLDIEIDGELYHKNWNGELCYRDQLRNHRLFELGWDVKRFWVYQIRDDLSWCIDQIKDWLKSTSL